VAVGTRVAVGKGDGVGGIRVAVGEGRGIGVGVGIAVAGGRKVGDAIAGCTMVCKSAHPLIILAQTRITPRILACKEIFWELAR
jgi:hypothetical protein